MVSVLANAFFQVLLRSIWTALRIVFDFKRTEVFKWISITLGGGVPALLLAVSIGVNGVSYRLYNVCIPNSQYGFVTWFVWLLVFASLASVILIFTILFCFWKFALSAIAAGLAGGNKFSGKSEEPTVSSVDGEKVPVKTKRARNRRKNVEWARIKRVLYLQWRTILLAFVVLNESIFYGLVFVQETAALEASTHGITQSDLAWGECLIVTGGNKNACLPLTNGLGLSKAKLIATLYIATVSPMCLVSLADTTLTSATDYRPNRLSTHAPLVHAGRLVEPHPAPLAVQRPIYVSLPCAPTKRWQPGLHHAGVAEAYITQPAAAVGSI